ncbi:unnamed protein product [Allacma fusca]|uniref:Uncharacterized protein n=1 Tax=Allacma fusca TaxID=39272 RepID=A0A8J2KC58_9HEXA|nr:unnamed protein product [Allacma fusca]
MNITLDTQDLRGLLLDIMKTEFKSNGFHDPQQSEEIKSELEKTKQLLEERSSQLKLLKDELQQMLKQIHSECIKLNQQNSRELKSKQTIQADNTTMRQLLEEMTTEVQNLKAEVREIRNDIRFKGIERSNSFNRKGKPELKEAMLPAEGDVEIQGKTEAEDAALTLLEIEEIKRSFDNAPSEGPSLSSGMNVFDISEGIPEIYKTTLTVELSNYLEVPLSRLQLYLPYGLPFTAAPKTIKKFSKEVFTFRDRHPKERNTPQGVFSYHIERTDLRIVVYFWVQANGKSELTLSFSPSDIPIENLYGHNSSLDESIRPDKKEFQFDPSEGISNVIVKLKDIRVKAIVTPGPRTILQLEILRKKPIGRSLVPSPKKKLQDGVTLAGRSISSISGGMTKYYGCVVEIRNNLNVALEQPSRYIRSCQQYDFLPEYVSAYTREAFFASHRDNVEGIFSYRIGTTDLRIAIAFRTNRNGNIFGVAFVPSHLATNQYLMVSLAKPDNWRTRPDRQLAKASDGEKTIEIRNIRVKVSMTEESKALLKISVSTF